MVAGTQTILVVEDNSEQLYALMEILRGEGYQVASATNGQEALDLLRSGLVPCLILLDLRMPVMGGWEFRRRQQEDPALVSIPVVVMTGARNRLEEARALAADWYFTEPYRLSELLVVVARYCRPTR